MSRFFRFMRVYTLNSPTILWVPALILAFSAAITFAIWALVPATSEPLYSGGINAPVWFFAFVGVQGVQQNFPFALALGVTRRTYTAVSFLTAGLLSLSLAAIITVGGAIEGTTAGWGEQKYFFRLPWMWADGWFGAFFLAAAIAWLIYIAGFGFTAVYKRTSLAVFILALGTLLLALVGAVAIAVSSAGWAALFEWFNRFGPLSTAATLAGICVLAAGASYMALRRLVIR